jgi:hypothetical protein
MVRCGEMKLRTCILIAASLSLALAGCSKKSTDTASAAAPKQQDAEAQIRTVIQARVASNGNLNAQAFDTVVNSVTVNGDHAQAQVDFRLKNGPGVMQLNYQIEKRDGSWVVTDSNPIGAGASHPPVDQGQAPSSGAADPHAGASHSLSDTLRSFRQDGATGSSPSLPPGHPAVSQPGASDSPRAE